MFQSAPPCGGRLPPATSQPMERPSPHVSIRAPVRGATHPPGLRRLPVGRGFNPRPRAGGDGLTSTGGVGRIQVSIRAPVRGATAAAYRMTG